MKNLYLFGCAILFSFGLWSQDFSWKSVNTYSFKGESIWSVDGLENVYIAAQRKLTKYDSAMVVKFSQSISALGPMTQLISINPMKLVYFSEQQQTMCFLDNTLSQMDKCVELGDLAIDNATQVSESVQPNKIWIYDNLNSRLLLVSLDRTYQTQEVGNIRGILGLEDVSRMMERNSRLLLLDKQKGVYVLDLYGSLLSYYEDPSIIDVDANEQMLFLLHQNQLEIRPFNSDQSYLIDLPLNGIMSFAYRNHFFYFETGKGVHKFRLHFSE